MKRLLFTLFLFSSLSGWAQRGPYLDSLWGVWTDVSKADTTRLKAMYDFAWDGFLFSQPDSSYFFSQQMYEFAQKRDLKEFQAKALNLQFSYYFGKGDIAKAEEANNKGMILWKAINDKLGLAANSTNFGILYQVQGNYTRAIEYYTLSLKYNEEINNRSGIGTSLHNIGHVYQDQLDFKKAVEYYLRSLRIREEEGELSKIAESGVNLGSVYLELHEYDKAMKSLERSLKIFSDLGIKGGEAAALGNIGMIYSEKKDYDKAIDYYSRSLKIQEELDDKITIAISLVNIGRVYLEQQQYEKAITFLNKGLGISKGVGDASGIKQASGSLSTAYKKTGKFKEALEMHELYLVMWDSLNSEESKKELVHQEFKYEYEKKATADSVKSAEEKKVVAVQLRQEQTQRYALYIGVVLLIVFGGFMFNRYKVTRKQKDIIEEQKLIVELKQREILDSILYARRIQRSLLPTENYIEKNLKRLFKKRDS